MSEQQDFRDMIDSMTNEMLICTVAAIIIVLEQLVPNAEQVIMQIAGSLVDALEGTNEQSDKGTTE